MLGKQEIQENRILCASGNEERVLVLASSNRELNLDEAVKGGLSKDNKNYALILLNQPLPKFTPQLWDYAKLRLCADGGANRVFDEMPLLLPRQDPVSVRDRYVPDVIKGDMDSIRTEVKDFYANLGSKIVDASEDQDTTDLHKCISFVQDTIPDVDKPDLCILVVGALGGRFDHEMGNINVLCNFSNIRIVLISDDCLIQLLPRTHHHEINILSSVEGPHCGLIPIATASAKATTSGLEWNLDDTEMKFGGLVSTSNMVREEKITVKSDSDLLWTISVRRTT
ncbi:hypothetical protein MKW94_006521 [Papaver nudicaule]|uniref:Thiamine pyrophosphokinase n=1 Tax=Papaver nudicaule TaxID=74823 RepID=A0AA42B4I4_PAPNU|nr:hypothetical protein [Papaver nudicaule]